MSQTYDSQKDDNTQKELMRIYRALVTQKAEKLVLMRKIKNFLKPSYTQLMARFNAKVKTLQEYNRQALFDNTCQNKMSHFSISSLSDIINPFTPWFTLNTANPRKEDEEAMRTWSVKANRALLDFINESSYYKALMTDKSSYDLYGFSTMTIANNDGKGMLIKAENPFTVLLYEDDTGIIGAMWEKRFTAYTMKKMFDYQDEEMDNSEGISNTIYEVVCACFPNTPDFIERCDESAGKYVQVFMLKKSVTLLEGELEKHSQQLGQDQTLSGKEIGSRRYYKELVTVPVRDLQETESSYGLGWGSKIFISAANLNQVHRNLIKSAEFAGNPPFIAPYDFHQRFRHIEPGAVYGQSGTGNTIEPIKVDVKISDLNNLLSIEKEQVNESVPVVGIPQQKKQRQSQLEVEKMLLEASKNSFIYKVVYLMEGVGKHLSKMYDIAVKQGRIEPPPEGIEYDEIKPNLSNIILKELKKVEARGFIEGINMSQAYLAMFREGSDNYRMDYILRTIMEAVGAGAGLEDFDIVEAIRTERQRQQKAQQEQQNALLQADAGAKGAQAQKLSAEANKAQSEAQEAQY